MSSDFRYSVYVSCMTYNHAPYIVQALDSFCMQQTSFPFVCGIIDDASTDGEQEILLQYFEKNFLLDEINIIRNEESDDYLLKFARHKTNSNCFFVLLLLKYNHNQAGKYKLPYVSEWRYASKYYALNEGDDYWIDPLKLQKQVDFMESHPNHSLCFCGHRFVFPSGETEDIHVYDKDMEVCPPEDLIIGNSGVTNALLYRQSMYVPYTTWAKGCPVGDAPMKLTLLTKGLVGYLSDVMVVYRRSATGSWSMRMASSHKMRRNHYHKMINMWHQFDEWSEHRFHAAVKKKIDANRSNYIKSEVLYYIKKIFCR